MIRSPVGDPEVRFMEKRHPDVRDDARPLQVGHHVGLTCLDPVRAIHIVLAVVRIVFDPDVRADSHAAALFPASQPGQALAESNRPATHGHQA